jgi:hypothetical protein
MEWKMDFNFFRKECKMEDDDLNEKVLKNKSHFSLLV